MDMEEILTELLDVVGLAVGILFQLILKERTIGLHEVLYGMKGIVVLLGRL